MRVAGHLSSQSPSSDYLGTSPLPPAITRGQTLPLSVKNDARQRISDKFSIRITSAPPAQRRLTAIHVVLHRHHTTACCADHRSWPPSSPASWAARHHRNYFCHPRHGSVGADRHLIPRPARAAGPHVYWRDHFLITAAPLHHQGYLFALGRSAGVLAMMRQPSLPGLTTLPVAGHAREIVDIVQHALFSSVICWVSVIYVAVLAFFAIFVPFIANSRLLHAVVVNGGTSISACSAFSAALIGQIVFYLPWPPC